MRRIVLITTLCAALAAPAAAEAATATTADGPLRYTAAAGESNNVSFARVSGDTFRVTELGTTIQSGTGCTQESPNVVSCTTAPGRSIIARLGDLQDVAPSRTSRSVQLFGEGGDDTLTGAGGRDVVDGGAGNDVLFGGGAGDRVRGGSGSDRLSGGSGGDSESGGSGDDIFDELPGP